MEDVVRNHHESMRGIVFVFYFFIFVKLFLSIEFSSSSSALAPGSRGYRACMLLILYSVVFKIGHVRHGDFDMCLN